MGVCVLGQVGARRSDGTLAVLAADKQATVLGVLAVHDGDVVGEESLMAALWPDGPPRSARTALQTYVSQVRSFLEPDRPRRAAGGLIATSPEGYCLAAGADRLDAARFKQLVSTALRHRTDPRRAAALLEEALALWAPPLGALADRPWAMAFVAQLQQVHRDAVEEHFAHALLMGRHAQVIDALPGAIAAEPYRERLVGQLMLALHRSGRQGEALALYRRTRERLVTDLGVEPGRELALLHRAILAGDAQLDFLGGQAVEISQPSILGGGPAAPLVGRREELTALAAALDAHRVVTVVGPGGAGKTRLVQQLLAGRDRARTWWVDLAPLSHDEEVPHAIARALRLVEHPLAPLGDQLASALDDGPALIVLDTCERVAAGVVQTVVQLLRSPGVRVLTTSRQPLRLGRAHLLRLEPLPLPTSDDPPAIIASDAVQLLCRRAGMAPEGASLPVLASICRRLDGLPLAIELAAHRLRAVGADQLDARLADDVGLLDGMADAPSRHRTIAATVRWSTDSLDAATQLALVRSAAFAGPFTLQAAERVLADEQLPAAAVLPVLTGLVEASLLTVEPDRDGRGVRYRMLDTVRTVARRQLLDAARRDQAIQRHTDWVVGAVGAAQEAGRHLRPSELPLESIAEEIDAVLERLHRTPGDQRHLVLAASLPFFWRQTGRLSEGRMHVDRALAGAGGSEGAAEATGSVGSRRLRAAAFGGGGFLAFYQGDFAAGGRLTAQAQALAEGAGLTGMAEAMRAPVAFARGDLDAAEQAMEAALDHYSHPGRHRLVLLDMGGMLAWFRGEEAVAADRFREEAAMGEQAGDDFVVAQALRGQGLMLAYLGEAERGWGLCTRSLGIATRRGDDLSVAQSHAASAAAALEAGVREDAAQLAVDALRRAARQFDVFALLVAVPVLALLDASEGREERAARLIGWYDALLDGSGVFSPPRSAAQLGQARQAVVAELGRSAAARLRAAGAGRGVRALVQA